MTTTNDMRRTAKKLRAVTWGGNKLDDFIAYAVADAADIIEAATAGKYGPRTRVIRVEYAGPAWL